MTFDEIIIELEKYGNAQTKKVLMNNGAMEPLYGVKVGDLKKIQKKIKKDYKLSMTLFETGNYDCMYLAGLIADEKMMTKEDLSSWMALTNSHAIAEYTVAWITAESDYGFEMAEEWMKSDNELYQTAAWSVMTSLSMLSGVEIEDEYWEDLIGKAVLEINSANNRVKYSINNFIIAMGGYNNDLSNLALEAARKIGKVEVDMGKTACKVPDAESYIERMIKMGRMGKKKKKARC